MGGPAGAAAATDVDGYLAVGSTHAEVGPAYDIAAQDREYEYDTALAGSSAAPTYLAPTPLAQQQQPAYLAPTPVDFQHQHPQVHGEARYAEVDGGYSSVGPAATSKHAGDPASALYVVPVPVVNSYDMPLPADTAYEYAEVVEGGGHYSVPTMASSGSADAGSPVIFIATHVVVPQPSSERDTTTGT